MNLNSQIEALQEARISGWGEINRYRLRAVLQHSGRSILDVGCATGSYIKYLNANGYVAYGFDLLPYSEWLKEGHRAFIRGLASNLSLSSGAFDTVTAFEILEHIPEPHKALQEFHRVCRQNIILTVPDCDLPKDVLRAGIVYAHWRDRTHCNFFTQGSLTDILEQTGFRVNLITRINPILPDFLTLRSLFVPFNLAYFASRVLRRLPFRRQYCMTLLVVADRV